MIIKNTAFRWTMLSLLIFVSSLLVSTNKADEPVIKFQKKYIADIKSFQEDLLVLGTSIAELDSTQVSVQKLKNSFYEARYSYKKTEMVMEYYYPRYAQTFNGPPVSKADENDREKVQYPQGLQMLEQYIFTEQPFQHKNEIAGVYAKTKVYLNNISSEASYFKTTDSHIFEMMRLEMIRINAMGLSGADATVSFNSIPEASSALASIKETVSFYTSNGNKKTAQLIKKIDKDILLAQKYLQTHTDFDGFDRLAFIVDFSNLISDDLFDLQNQLGIQRLPFPTAYDFRVKNIFAKNAFNKNFFSYYINDTTNQAQKAAIGKLLFFDPVLSGDSKRACASCHMPSKGFADGLIKSAAFESNGQLKRNAPTLLNVSLQRKFFHDGRTMFLEDQIADVVHNTSEMNGNIERTISLLKKSDEYVALFKQAFSKTADTLISSYAIRKSIVEYEKTLTSFNSRFDQYVRGNKKALNTSEVNGYNLFEGKAKCGTCHFTPLFNGTVPPMYLDSEMEIIGVPETKEAKNVDPDHGRYLFTFIDMQKGLFKIPTVRNIELTAPYMHNGVYSNLDEVMDFYIKGGGAGHGLEVPGQTLPFDKLILTEKEKQDIISFMKALTDTSGLLSTPKKLPAFKNDPELNKRMIGGSY